ncbi:MAG: DUF3127 domain-containing protein [Bacteroidota bacterium]
MEIKGRIKAIFEAQTYGNGNSKREFVVTTDEQYPQHIKLELYKDKVNLIHQFREGDFVNVQFNLRGNENNGRYYVNLNAWKITREDPTSETASVNQSEYQQY